MYMYMYMYMYIYIYIYLSISLSIYVYIYIYIYVTLLQRAIPWEYAPSEHRIRGNPCIWDFTLLHHL